MAALAQTNAVAVSAAKQCQLCKKYLVQFDVHGRTNMWFCTACRFYQYGILAGEDAYHLEYHEFYDKYRGRKLRTAAVRLHRIESLLEQDRPLSLLDIGSSLGVTLEAANKRGWNAVGVDISRDTVHYCNERGLESYHYSGFKLPFPDCSFDALTAWHVIEHVENALDTLVEWRRVLRPGGVMVLETPDASTFKVGLLQKRYRRFWIPEHTYAFTPATLKQFVINSGLEILPNPPIGRLGDASPWLLAFELAYQFQAGLKRSLGIRKGFRVFARRGICQPSLLQNAA